MTGIVSVYATFGDEAEARQIARTCIEEKLAACANIWPVASIYRWQGAIEDAQEFAALFKTSAECSEALIARIAALHSYDVPAAIVWPIENALSAYSDWIDDETA